MTQLAVFICFTLLVGCYAVPLERQINQIKPSPRNKFQKRDVNADADELENLALKISDSEHDSITESIVVKLDSSKIIKERDHDALDEGQSALSEARNNNDKPENPTSIMYIGSKSKPTSEPSTAGSTSIEKPTNTKFDEHEVETSDEGEQSEAATDKTMKSPESIELSVEKYPNSGKKATKETSAEHAAELSLLKRINHQIQEHYKSKMTNSEFEQSAASQQHEVEVSPDTKSKLSVQLEKEEEEDEEEEAEEQQQQEDQEEAQESVDDLVEDQTDNPVARESSPRQVSTTEKSSTNQGSRRSNRRSSSSRNSQRPKQPTRRIPNLRSSSEELLSLLDDQNNSMERNFRQSQGSRRQTNKVQRSPNNENEEDESKEKKNERGDYEDNLNMLRSTFTSLFDSVINVLPNVYTAWHNVQPIFNMAARLTSSD